MITQAAASNMSAYELALYIDTSNSIGEDFEMLAKLLAKKTIKLSVDTENTLKHIAITAENQLSTM
jgi:hypothetical protein